jgi:hypothetical protein
MLTAYIKVVPNLVHHLQEQTLISIFFFDKEVWIIQDVVC